MVKQRPSGFRTYTSSFAVAIATAAVLGVGGCSASSAGAPAGPGMGDGGDDGSSTGGDGAACPALGCNPACPNGVLKDSNGCDTCQCAPASDAGGSGTCMTDSNCGTGKICGFLEADGCAATGRCFPAPGARCALASAIGCGCHGNAVPIDPGCVSGLPVGYQPQPVLHEGVCTDGGSSDGGGCVSQQGGPCGGNTSHPCTCASGLTCTPGDGGGPFGDVGGTCR
jgi:hypothetical protein